MAGLLFSEVYLIIPAEPAPPPAPWLVPALGAAALAAAALIAWRRVTRADPHPARRAARIGATASTFAAAAMLMTAPGVLREPEPLMPRLPLQWALGLGIGFVGLALLGLLLFATADFLLDALRPHRTRPWLALAPPLLAGFVLGLFFATGWFEAGGADAKFGPPMLGTAAAAAGFTWWSMLPKPGEFVASIFS